jgi:porphobilinogen synthase
METPEQFINNRRLRANQHIRELANEVYVSHKDFIQPMFVEDGIAERQANKGLANVYTETTETVLRQIEQDIKSGVTKFLLFPIPNHKVDSHFNFDFAANLTSSIKSTFGNSIWLANDVCLCSYTDHGHCGILNNDGTRLLNNETVKILAAYSLQLAQAGSDCIAPSDMTDGRILAIRQLLNGNSFDHVALMSYAAKFSSSLYGPFRDVCKSAPNCQIKLNDRKSYQLNFANPRTAIAAALRDSDEGADIIMVKPAIAYLDVIQSLHQQVHQPIAGYHVSGEYASIELLAANNFGERDLLHLEAWTAMKRAGASIIISYVSREAKKWID